MKETEVTVQVFEEFKKINEKLKSQGFCVIENFQLNDWYFSKFDDVRGVKYPDLMNNSFLVRQVLTDKEEVQICYKKKEMDDNNNVIFEEKIKTFVDSLVDAVNIFKCAGLNNYCVVKNNSYIYQKGNMLFTLQIIENLGIFIEYEEDESMKNLNVQEKRDYMISALKSLNLKLGDDYSCKKVYMLLQKNC